MSISLNANFELLSAGLYLDARQQFNTIIEMKDFAETSIPDGFITYNKETQKHYVFNSSNTVDATLGKWREYNSGNSSSTTYATWNSNVDYKVGNIVLKDEVRYSCIADHTSTDFETDSINWVVVLEQYYHVTQEQYNKMVSDGLITDSTKDLYIIDGNNEGDNNSTHKTVIFENNIDMGKYLLLAKITGANYSNNIIKFSCPNYKGVNDAGFKYENDMDIYKFELHFNTGSRREINSYGVTLKQHGLGLYSYPLSNPKNTEPKIEEAIRLYWDYSKGDIYVFLVDLMTAIPHCVLEYTGSGTLLRKDTFVMDDLYNRRDGLNGTWEDSKWKSIPYNKLEVPPIYELGGGSAEGLTTYTTIEDLGLTADATIQDVIDKVQVGETALLRTDAFTNWSTLFNGIQWGYLKVEKTVNGLSNIELQEVVTPNRRYFGIQSSGKFNKWQQVASEITDVLTNTSTIDQVPNANLVANEIHGKYIDTAKYSDALAMPIGKWRVDSNNKASQMQNLPVPKAGILEIKYLHGNDGTTAYTGTYKYAMLTYTAIDGEKYERSFNSDATVGNIVNDTGWRTVIIENAWADPYSCAGYKRLTGTEDLFTLGTGHYVTEKADTAYNYPITDTSTLTAHIYVLGYLNDPSNNIGYRIILYFDNKGRTYNANEWWGTFGSWNRLDNDTRVTTLETQVSELFQSVSNGKTLVANAITGKGVSTSTTATFATMATNIGKISGGYKEETKTLIVTSNTTGTQVLPFTFSANVIAVKQIVAPSYDGSQGTCSIVTSTSKNIFSINGKEVTFYVRGTGRWEVTALVQA